MFSTQYSSTNACQMHGVISVRQLSLGKALMPLVGSSKKSHRFKSWLRKYSNRCLLWVAVSAEVPLLVDLSSIIKLQQRYTHASNAYLFSYTANVNRKTVDFDRELNSHIWEHRSIALLVDLSSHCERFAHLIQFMCTRYSRDDLITWRYPWGFTVFQFYFRIILRETYTANVNRKTERDLNSHWKIVKFSVRVPLRIILK